MYDTLALCFHAVRALWLGNTAKVPTAVGLKLGLAYSWRESLDAQAGKHVFIASLSFLQFHQTDILRQR